MAASVTKIAVGINSENNASIYEMLLRLKNTGVIKEQVFTLLIASFRETIFRELSEEEVSERTKTLPEDFDYDRVRHWVVDSGSIQLFRAMLSLDCRLSLGEHGAEDMKTARKTQAVVFFILKNIPSRHSQKANVV